MSLFTNYVLYRESPDTHEEIYFCGLSGRTETTDSIEVSDEPEEGIAFPTAAEAYAFAADKPALQWWKVGKR